ncbi:MAG: hypothetical protein A2252_04480 [Elusimicrobia bacterium RIFOXYA2_FULL_39_19]|nr:MAG: hypothetical protein A2252_04480 [Elusimicrobia bacterium RIFOXYA2_FULL_39_19]
MSIIFKNDNYYLDYYVNGLRVREKVGPNRRFAELAWAKRKVQAHEEKFFETPKNKKLKFYELCDSFSTNYSKPNKRKRSYERDLLSIKHLKAYFGDVYISRITPQEIERYKMARQADMVSFATINRETGCLRNIFNRAKDWEMVDSNPMDKVKLYKESPGKIRYLTQEETQRLLSNCSGYLRNAIIFALNTGCRKEEVLSLKWSDIDFRTATIHIPASTSKTNIKREIMVNSALLRTLQAIERYPNGEYVFCDEQGNRFKRIDRTFKTALKRANIQDFRFHDLRHTFCSNLVMSGIDIYTVKELVGHESIEMTMRYSHLAPNFKRQAVEILSARMNKIEKENAIGNFWTQDENSGTKKEAEITQFTDDKH